MLRHKTIMKSRTTFFILLSVGLILATVGIFFRPVHAQTWVEGHIPSDTTWRVADSPYRAVNDVIVDPGVLLTIEPGVEVQFADGFSLIVEGSLNAVGTYDNPIVFTSSRLSPSPGAWNTIHSKGNSSEQFSLRHTKVEYAIHGATVESNGSTTIANSEIINCSESGLFLAGESNVIIKQNHIKYNQKGIATDSATTHSGIMINNNTISENLGNGVDLHSQGMDSPTLNNAYLHNVCLSSNTISFNGGHGIYLYSRGRTANGYAYIYDIAFSANIISFNNGNGINMDSYNFEGGVTQILNVTFSYNTVSSNGENGIHLDSRGYDRYIYGINFSSNNISSNGANGIYLHCHEELSLEQCHSYIYGINFSSNNISSNGANGIYLDSYSSAYWYCYSHVYGVALSSNTISFNGANGVQSCSISRSQHGKAETYDVTFYSNNVFLNNGTGISLMSEGDLYNILVAFNNVAANSGNGIHIDGMTHFTESIFDMLASNNAISANHQMGIRVDGGINANLTGNSISHNLFGIFYSGTQNNLATDNDIYSNSYGINVAYGATVNAEYNYWGHSTGPYHESLNPEGEGNSVNGDGIDLDFIPFLTSPVGTINQRPVAILEVDKNNPIVDETVTLDASGSTDDGRVDYYFFDFGDGAKSGWTSLSVVTHKYASEGTYNSTLIVMDDFGVTSFDGDLVYTEITVVPEFPPFLILPFFMILTLATVILGKKMKSLHKE